MKDFANLEKNLGYEFKDKGLLSEALTHKSAKKPYNNERLEFLGDAVLDLIVGEFLFLRFAKHSEGELSKLRAALVNEKSFAKISLNLELGKYIFMSNAEQNNDGRSKPSILSDALESLIAAIYLEAGFERAKSVALSLLEANFPHIDAAHLVRDYKTKLQEFTQSAMAQAPEYETLRAFGPDHKKQFEIALKLDGKEFARAVAGSKKEAQQRAAQITLEKLGVL